MAGLPVHIEKKIAEATEAESLFLLEIIRRGQQNSTVLEVIVDSEEGANLDTLAQLSRAISQVLDEDESAIKGRYRLEVSTPGLDRPLKHDWQFRKNIGRLLKITWQEGEDHRTELFRLLTMTESGLRLESVQKTKGKKQKVKKVSGSTEPILLSFEQIEQATVEAEI